MHHAIAAVAIAIGRPQPSDRRRVHVVATRDVGQAVALRQPSKYLGALMWCEFGRTAELHAARLGALTAFAGALTDQLSLELGNGGE